MTRLLGPLVAVLGGVAWALCFGREPLLLAPWAALAPLILLLGDRRAGRLGWLHGAAYWLTAVPWIRPTLETFGRLPDWLAALLMIVLAVYLGAYHGAFAWLGRRLWRRGGVVAVLGLPALWVALEWVRTYVWGGFPWNLAGYAWVEAPGALALAPWTGPYGISFLVVGVNTALALAIARRRPTVWLAAVGACLTILAFGARWAGGPALEDLRGPATPVRLIQPNTRNLIEWDPAVSRAAYERLLRLSEEACDVEGALLVWPESATWPRGWRDPGLRADLERLAARGCDVILNSAESDGERLFNSALLIERGELAGRYDKRHLVPYGEYVPLARWLPFVGTLARMAGQFTPGDEPSLIDFDGQRLGMAICFEVIFPSEVAALVREGATALVSVSNDAWYGDSSAPWQHFRAARFRAAEMRRPLLRAAITGVSGVVGPDGRVVESIGVFEEGILRVDLRSASGLSPAARWPWLGPGLCSALAAFVIFAVGSRAGSGRPRNARSRKNNPSSR